MHTVNTEREASSIHVTGLVQGVGFRPFVRNLATRLNLNGSVRNTAAGVLIEAEGEPAALSQFIQELRARPPQHARIADLTHHPIPVRGAQAFTILESATGVITTDLPPDLASCDACLRELRNPSDRRFGYPFISCTQCGPRHSICETLPWDRPDSTMQDFTPCPRCLAETLDPSDRRYHSQTNACANCGPTLSFSGDLDGPPLAAAIHTLELGLILACKALGGFQLMVDAGNAKAVERLRARKRRGPKPMAVLYPDLAAIRRDCYVSEAEADALTSAARPIVLLQPRERQATPHIGAMLASTPLQVLLLDALQRPLIATSGNLSGETLCTDNAEAQDRLKGIADAWLMHDRRIAEPLDDSMVLVVEECPMLLRRARGYPRTLSIPAPEQAVLATGAQLKNTVAATRSGKILLSQHIGDLETFSTRTTHAALAESMHPQDATIAQDLHPDYATRQEGGRCVGVQHHEAHAWAGIAEHRLEGHTLAIVWDGTGYGHDGTIWGGESFVIQGGSCQRVSSLVPFRLVGSEAAIREPVRIAASLLLEAGIELEGLGLSAEQQATWRIQHTRGLNAPVCSAMGRLFDGVSALLGLIHRVEYEGQAAIALQHAIQTEAEPYSLTWDAGKFDWRPMVREIMSERRCAHRVAARFHRTLVSLIVALAHQHASRDVLLTGGCFQNCWLLNNAIAALREAGFEAHWPQEIPPNDGGLAVGQVVAACV